MKASTAVVVACLALLTGNGALAQTEEIDEDNILEFLQDSLRTCSGITRVTRSGSDFRVIDYTNLRREFSLKDLNSPHGHTGDMFQLRCGPPGCVAQFTGIADRWSESPPANSAFFQCDEDLVRRMKVVVLYYKKHYGD